MRNQYGIWVSCIRRHFRKRFLLILTAALCYILYRGLPNPPNTKNNNVGDRPGPQRELQAKPNFMYRSRWRENPDLAYEAELEEALLNIERTAPPAGEAAVKKIWQIMLDDNDDRGPDSELFEQVNTDWSYTLVSSAGVDFFLTETSLATIPDLMTLYESYPHHVLRNDLLRYLLLWYHGGFYADMDVYPALPISYCQPLVPFLSSTPPPTNISLVVGVEIDEPYASPKLMHDWHWSRSYGFIQFAMYAPRRFSPLLRRTIVRVLAHTKRHNAAGKVHLGVKYDEQAILEVTGPGVFTDAVLDVLSENLPRHHPWINTSVEADAKIGDLVPTGSGSAESLRRVSWAPFHRLREPVWIEETEVEPEKGQTGGLLVLPISVWGNGQRHSGAERFDSPTACINHRFGRRWKKGWWEYLFG